MPESKTRVALRGAIRDRPAGDDDFTHKCQATVTGDARWWAEVIEPPEAPLDEEPAAPMVRALSNPIYVKVTSTNEYRQR